MLEKSHNKLLVSCKLLFTKILRRYNSEHINYILINSEAVTGKPNFYKDKSTTSLWLGTGSLRGYNQTLHKKLVTSNKINNNNIELLQEPIPEQVFQSKKSNSYTWG